MEREIFLWKLFYSVSKAEDKWSSLRINSVIEWSWKVKKKKPVGRVLGH